MAKSLVIVESPAKAKTINKYLGKDFIVKSSVGHVRDLPHSSTGKKVAAKSPAEVRKMAPAAKAKYKAKRDKLALVFVVFVVLLLLLSFLLLFLMLVLLFCLIGVHSSAARCG